MLNYTNMINRLLLMIILLLVGVLSGKLGYVNKSVRRALGDLTVYIFVPCSSFSMLLVDNCTVSMLHEFAFVALLGFSIYITLYFAAKLFFKKMPLPKRDVMRFSFVAPNAAFMGIPVISGFYGREVLFLSTALLIPSNFFLWNVADFHFGKIGVKKSAKSFALHPTIIAIVIGLLCLIGDFRPPVFFNETVSMLGEMTTVTAMLIVGSIFSELKAAELFKKDAFIISFIRLVAIPLLVLSVLFSIGIDVSVAQIIVLCLGMPLATAAVIMTGKYSGDEAFASKGVVTSTLISMVTLPMLAILIEKIYSY